MKIDAQKEADRLVIYPCFLLPCLSCCYLLTNHTQPHYREHAGKAHLKGKAMIAAKEDLDKKVAMKTARREKERGEGVLLDIIFPPFFISRMYVSPTHNTDS